MAPFEELQILWQSQNPPVMAVAERDAASLAKAFHRYGRRQDLINLGKALLLAVQLMLLVGRLRHNPVEMFGVALIDCSAVYFMIYEWRRQRAIARLNFAAPSRDFVHDAIARLMAQRHPFRGRQAYIMTAGFWAGFSVMMASRWPTVGLRGLLIREAVITALAFVVLPFSNYLRAKRWNLEGRPLVERLNALLEASQERAE